MKQAAITLAVLLLPAMSLLAQESAQEFVTKATVSNKFEIASSELALERSVSQPVRDFAQHMIEDHRKAGRELEKVVKEAGQQLTIPTDMDPTHAEMMQELNEDTSDGFQQTYVKQQKKAHDEAIKLFESFIESGDDAALRQFAEKTLPTLREHGRQVEQLGESGGG